MNHFTGDEVTLSGFNGSPCVANLAEVLFEINGKSFVEIAAIVPARTTNHCVLLTVDRTGMDPSVLSSALVS